MFLKIPRKKKDEFRITAIEKKKGNIPRYRDWTGPRQEGVALDNVG